MAKKKHKEKEQSLYNRLKKKNRLVVVDLESYEEIRHFNFSTLNIIIYFLFVALIIIAGTWTTIAYSPIKQAIPGYPNISKQKQLAYLEKKNLAWIEQQKQKLNREHLYYKNLQTILSDSVVRDSTSLIQLSDSIDYTNQDFSVSAKDSILRLKIEEQEKYLVSVNKKNNSATSDLKGILFFPPVNGVITDSINVKIGHFGVDLIAPNNEPVKATLNGTVIFTDWTPDNGNVIHVQHDRNLVSVYKHNSVLLKKIGDVVKTGEPIAIIGNSGKLSSGPHLHLELWHKGVALNPLEYILF